MPVAQSTLDAVDLNELKLPASLAVCNIEVEEYYDFDGDEALRVNVIIDESVDVENFNGREIGDLHQAIGDSLRAHGVTVFPYIFIFKESERNISDEEE